MMNLIVSLFSKASQSYSSISQQGEPVHNSTPHAIPYTLFNYGYTPVPLDSRSASRLAVSITKKESGDVVILTAPNTLYGKMVCFIFGDRKNVANELQTDLTKKYGEKVAQQVFTKQDYTTALQEALSTAAIKKFYAQAAAFSQQEREILTKHSPSHPETSNDTPQHPDQIACNNASEDFEEDDTASFSLRELVPLGTQADQSRTEDLQDFYSPPLWPESNEEISARETQHHQENREEPHLTPITLPVSETEKVKHTPEAPLEKEPAAQEATASAPLATHLQDLLKIRTTPLPKPSSDFEKAKIIADLKDSYNGFREKLIQLHGKRDLLQKAIAEKKETAEIEYQLIDREITSRQEEHEEITAWLRANNVRINDFGKIQD